MIDSISNAAQDRAQDALGATIALAQGFPSLRCERSRRPTRPVLRPASTLDMESTIWCSAEQGRNRDGARRSGHLDLLTPAAERDRDVGSPDRRDCEAHR